MRTNWREAVSTMAIAAMVSLTGVAVGAGIAVLIAQPAWPHEAPTGWMYPMECCSNRDCSEIPSDRVKEGPEGYRVTLLPGDHDFVKAPVSHLIPYAITKPSPDGLYHICLLPSGGFICFFAGARNF